MSSPHQSGLHSFDFEKAESKKTFEQVLLLTIAINAKSREKLVLLVCKRFSCSVLNKGVGGSVWSTVNISVHEEENRRFHFSVFADPGSLPPCSIYEPYNKHVKQKKFMLSCDSLPVFCDLQIV